MRERIRCNACGRRICKCMSAHIKTLEDGIWTCSCDLETDGPDLKPRPPDPQCVIHGRLIEELGRLQKQIRELEGRLGIFKPTP